jgi:hypothetical protein
VVRWTGVCEEQQGPARRGVLRAKWMRFGTRGNGREKKKEETRQAGVTGQITTTIKNEQKNTTGNATEEKWKTAARLIKRAPSCFRRWTWHPPQPESRCPCSCSATCAM